MTERWTIVDENSLPVIEFTTFISLDYAGSSKALDYPAEEGTFATYNKVVPPIEIDLTVGAEGTDVELQDKLAILESLKNGTQQVDIITPYKEFKSYTLTDVNYSLNTDDGVGVIYFNLRFKEVKEVGIAFTNSIKYSKDASNSSTVETGQKQTISVLSKGTKALTGQYTIF